MATQLQLRRGTNAETAQFTGAEGELSVNVTNESVVVHDGTNAGGQEMARADLGNVDNIATTATGIEVSGTLSADGVKTDHTDGFYIDNSGATEAYWTHTAATGSSVINVGRDSSWGGDLTIKTDTKSRALFSHNGDISFYKDTGTPKFLWDASAEALLVGSTQLNYSATKVQTGSSTVASAGFNVFTSETGNGYLLFSDGNVGNQSYAGQIRYNHTDDLMGFGTGGSERVTIDSTGMEVTGNLLVGTTDDVVWNNSANSAADNGHNLREDGRAGFAYYNATANANSTVNINRTGSDGDLIKLFKSGTTVGSIGVQSSGLVIDGEASHTGLRFTSAGVTPRFNKAESDNTVNLGESGVRFKDLHLSGGVYLGGTVAANKFDDYEPGNWTPVIRRIDGTIGATFNFARATYVKVGRLVTIKVYVYNLVAGSSDGASYWTMLGVPFLGQSYSSSYLGHNSTSSDNCYIGDAGGNIIFSSGNASYSGSLTGSFMLNMTYETNS